MSLTLGEHRPQASLAVPAQCPEVVADATCQILGPSLGEKIVETENKKTRIDPILARQPVDITVHVTVIVIIFHLHSLHTSLVDFLCYRF